MYETDPEAKRVIDVAKGLEGLRRGDGIHAAAVVITDQPLTEYVPIQRKPDNNNPDDAPDRHPVRDARGRGPRPAQDGLPGPAQPVGHRAGPRPHRGLHRPAARHRQHPPRRRGHLRDAAQGRLDGRLPARGRPHALAHALARPHHLRRRGRPGRPVPAGPDGGQHAPGLRGPQERPPARHLRAPRPRGHPGRHLRPDDLPGVGHAGGPEVRRLHAGRGRQPAQGVRQEDPGPHPGRAREVRRRLRGRGVRRGARHRPVRHHRALRRLRLQQVPLLRLRLHRLPDGLAQGPLPGRVPRQPPHPRQGQQGQDGDLPRRVPLARHRGAGPRRQPVAGRVHPGLHRRRGRHRHVGRQPGRHHLRPGRRAQRRRGAGRPHRGRARGSTAPSSTSTTSASGSTPRCSTSGPSSR